MEGWDPCFVGLRKGRKCKLTQPPPHRIVPSFRAGGKSLTLKGHGKGVRSVAFSADDRLLLTASDDKSVKLWSVASRKFRGGLQGHSHWVRSAVFGPGDRTALSGGDDRTAKVGGWVGLWCARSV